MISAGFDPTRIDEAGWGILFPAGENPRVVEALEPLLRRRREQAGDRYRQFQGQVLGVQPGETKNSWLRRQGAGPGPADPSRVPYYLLIAASPAQISFQFESQLNVQYAVGRIWFGRLADWSAYAVSVLRAEDETRPHAPRLAFFHPAHPGDPYTQAVSSRMQELAWQAQSAGRFAEWQAETLAGPDANRAALAALLAENPPNLAVIAGHGLVFPPGHKRQRGEQGGLVCADWPGPASGLPPRAGQCFLASDIPAEADLNGSVFVLHASYSLGTPDFDPQAGDNGKRLARLPFTARLPQRMLSLPDGRGALAVAGWNNRLWSIADPHQAAQENTILESCLAALAARQPAGSALEFFSQRYAEVSTALTDYLTQADYGASVDLLKLGGFWAANHNARSLALFGDPAARLPVFAPADVKQAAPESIYLKSYLSPPVSYAAQAGPGSGPVELEVRLTLRGYPGVYGLAMQIEDPGGGEAGQLAGELRLDMEQIRALSGEPHAYGHLLWNSLFADEARRALLLQALASAGRQNTPLRLRLTLDPAAGGLLDLPWETILEPGSGSPLARQEQPVWFTRTVSEAAWSAAEPRLCEKPRALAAVAAPDHIEKWSKAAAPVSREEETARARMALTGYEVTVLTDTAERVTLSSLAAALRGGYDVLYLVCQAARSTRGEIGLLFEQPNGEVSLIGASQFTQIFASLSAGLRPRLVVLLPPLSGGQTGQSAAALASLAPALTRAGAAAALTLQAGPPAVQCEQFLGHFFKRLAAHGQPDLALSEARTALTGADQNWAWVLYTRPAAARLWTAEQPVSKDLAFGPAAPPEPFDITLTRQGVAEYAVEMSFRGTRTRGQARLDFAGLQALAYDLPAYGALLAQNLLADSGLSAFFQQTLQLARTGSQLVQLRLAADPGAAELHTLRWEALADPSTGSILALSEDLSFTRHLFSADWRKVEVRSGMREGSRRRLILAASSPADLTSAGLIQLEIPPELLKAVESAPGLEAAVLGRNPDDPVTLERLARELKGGADVLWLISHGSAVRGEPVLLLADKANRARPVQGSELVKYLSAYARMPALVHITGSSSAPLGLALAGAGVPAVLVMNGSISKRTYRRFAPVFLTELLADANPARAAAVARSAVYDQPDWWAPVLFTRLKEPNLW